MQPEASPPQATPPTNTQQAQILAWLDEERRRDKAEMQRLQSAVEQMLSRYREAIGRLEVAEAEVRQVRAQLSRLGHSEDGLREVREALVKMQEWQEEHNRTSIRAGQSLAIAAERDQRTLAEIQTGLADLARESEALKGRVALLGEELRRDQGSLTPVQQQVDVLEKRLQALAGRLDLVDEAQRHRNLRSVELAQQLERLAAEQARFTDWQRLAEVRWSRQLTDWQAQMEEWRRQSEDGVREVQNVAKSVPGIKDDLAELRRALVEERERGTERSTAIAELAAQRGIDREAIGQAEQRVLTLTGRLDQMASQLLVAAEKIDRLFDGQNGLEGRIRAERERIEAILLAIARLEERDGLLERRLDELQRELSGQNRAQSARSDEIERSLSDLARRMDMRVAELERLEEEHKQREIMELEQQIREMQERAKQAKG